MKLKFKSDSPIGYYADKLEECQQELTALRKELEHEKKTNAAIRRMRDSISENYDRLEQELADLRKDASETARQAIESKVELNALKALVSEFFISRAKLGYGPKYSDQYENAEEKLKQAVGL